jgi:polyvinyl alcohol dehydrogenase (cytochrome)
MRAGMLRLAAPAAGAVAAVALAVPMAVAAPVALAAPDPPNAFDLVPHAAPAPLSAGEWPFYGHDVANSRDGGTAGPSPTQAVNLRPVWSVKSTDGDFTGTPVEADGTVVAVSGGGTVFAIDASTGALRWSRDLGQPANASAAIAGGLVYVPLATTSAPAVAALSLADGSLVWSTVLDSSEGASAFGSPVVWNGTVYMGTSGELGDPNLPLRGAVVALDAATGATRWRTYTVPPGFSGGPVWSTPTIDAATGRLYVGTGNAYNAPVADTTDAILAIDAASGAIVGHFQATAGDAFSGSDSAAGPDFDFGASANLITAADGRKLVGEGQKDGTYWALDRATMEPAWSQTTGPGTQLGGIIGSTAYDGARIYGPDTPAGEQWALTPAGAPAWLSSDGGPLHFNPTTVANGVVYTADMSGVLTVREASTGAILLKLPLGAPSYGGVSVAGGYVFAVTGTQGDSGYVVAYRAPA